MPSLCVAAYLFFRVAGVFGETDPLITLLSMAVGIFLPFIFLMFYINTLRLLHRTTNAGRGADALGDDGYFHRRGFSHAAGLRRGAVGGGIL